MAQCHTVPSYLFLKVSNISSLHDHLQHKTQQAHLIFCRIAAVAQKPSNGHRGIGEKKFVFGESFFRSIHSRALHRRVDRKCIAALPNELPTKTGTWQIGTDGRAKDIRVYFREKIRLTNDEASVNDSHCHATVASKATR